MSRFMVYVSGNLCDFLVEPECFSGVRKIADTVAEDISLGAGSRPKIHGSLCECSGTDVVLMATAGKSPILTGLARRGLVEVHVDFDVNVDVDADVNMGVDLLTGRRESFLLQIVEKPFPEQPGIERLLVIAGSDKRGTLYGMFHFSEMCGVSPLVWFGDARPAKKMELSLELDKPFLSKEPSVMYRGFFINDEWPAFGNWSKEKYGCANAQAYRRIFELLLRLKGNYLWPAMWDSSFWEDGPGIENARLADEYGIIIGTSHHEPMCRAGVEWQRQYTNYGEDNTWSFVTNEEPIRKFWEDGIIRALPYENVITIGMRGENDSKLLPEDAGLAENIGVVKKAILAQNEILKKHFGEDLSSLPRMLAIYKEVEDYYYGDEETQGLKDWEELEDVIFLLSDDNYGHLRALPTKEETAHPGGYGMYFHFDYHGSPISYEWVNCNRLTRTWEQMCRAWEAGVRRMWIVNVGDLKGMEYPLSYFLDLAYDFEKWGSGVAGCKHKVGCDGLQDMVDRELDASIHAAIDPAVENTVCPTTGSTVYPTTGYLTNWIRTQFGENLTKEQERMLFAVIEGYTRWNACTSPESMRPGIYHPVHFREGERVRREVNSLLSMAGKLKEELTEEALDAYLSMIYYPAAASLNLILLHLDAGENEELARRGCIRANKYEQIIRERIELDEALIREFHSLFDGKWNHMLRSAHTGFRSWDDRDWTYPQAQKVYPLPYGKILVSFRGSDDFHLGAHWQDKEPLVSDDLTRPDAQETVLDIDSRGRVPFSFEIEYEGAPWLNCDPIRGRVEISQEGHNKGQGEARCIRVDRSGEMSVRNRKRQDGKAEDGHACVTFTADRSMLHGRQEAEVLLKVFFDDGETTYSKLLIRADGETTYSKSLIQADEETTDANLVLRADGLLEENVLRTERPDRTDNTSDGIFLERQGYCCIRAEHFACKQDVPEGGYQVIGYLGREGAAVTALPAMQSWEDVRHAPRVTYRMAAENSGEYIVRIFMPAVNPTVRGGRLRFALSVNGQMPREICGVSEGYYTEWFDREWAQGVLSHVHTVETEVTLGRGLNEISLHALDPGVILEKLVFYPAGRPLPESFFGPEESFRCVSL